MIGVDFDGLLVRDYGLLAVLDKGINVGQVVVVVCHLVIHWDGLLVVLDCLLELFLLVKAVSQTELGMLVVETLGHL